VRRTLSIALLVLPATTALAYERSASAEPRGREQGRALDLFEQSAKAYREGRFQDAVDLLLEARKVKPEPVLLYNLGRAYEALGKSVEAAEAYEQYLREDPRAADRRAIEGRVSTLRAQAAELEKARATPAGGNDDRRDRSNDVVPPAEPESAAVAPWVVAGLGLAVIGAGFVTGAIANSKHDDAVAEPRQAAAQEKQDSAESLATTSTILFVAGGVVTAVGLGWLGLRAFSASPQPSSVRGVRVVPGLGSIALGARF